MTTARPQHSRKIIAAGFGLSVVLMVALLVVGLMRMHAINQGLHSVVHEYQVKADLVNVMRVAWLRRGVTLHRLSILDDPFDREEHFTRFNFLASDFMAARTHLIDMGLNEHERAILAEIDTLTQPQPQLTAAEMTMAGDLHGAGDTILQTMMPQQIALERAMDRMVELQADYVAEAIESADRAYFNALVLMLATGLIAVLIGSTTARVVARRVEAVEQALRTSEARSQAILSTAVEGIVTADQTGIIQSFNPAAETIFGYRADEVIGEHVNMLLPATLREGHDHAMSRHLSGAPGRLQGTGRETRALRKDGSMFPVYVSLSHMREGPNVLFTAFLRDITAQKRAEKALYREKELAQVTLHAIGDAVIRTDARGLVEYLNPVAEALTGWRQAEAHGRPLPEVFTIIDENRQPIESPVEICLRENMATPLTNHSALVSRTGGEYAVEDSAAPLRDRKGRIIGAVLVFRDVTERRRITQEMAYQASHDPLTGLFNRRKFEAQVKALLDDRRAGSRRHSLLYIDLDQFKVVNDTCGHQAGDELLRRLTAVLAAGVRQSDTLARLGGDEFGLLLVDCPLERAEQIATKLLDTIRGFPFTWQGKTFAIGASIGAVEIDAENDSLSGLLSAADSACYTAKDKGRNRLQVYRSWDKDLAQRHDEMTWVSRITQAVEEHRFLLYHQAIADTRDTGDGPLHYEILLRMRDEHDRVVAPAVFIPAAERYNLMPTLDRWVIRRVFAGIKDRLGAEPGARGHIYSINLSGTSLSDDGFPGFVRERFKEFCIPPQAVCFEVTETAAITNITRATAFIDEMRALGCAISLDDFGSGLSSFAYLKNLRVDYLKVDGTFVKDMATNPIDCAMVRAIHEMGRVMGIRTVAEYVETPEVLEMLRELGVEYVQGYGIHRPEPWQWDPEFRQTPAHRLA